MAGNSSPQVVKSPRVWLSEAQASVCGLLLGKSKIHGLKPALAEKPEKPRRLLLELTFIITHHDK
jgi:hypothetical protein